MTYGKRHLLFDIALPGFLLLAIIALGLLLLTLVAKPADAHCPPGTAYGCIRDYDGKQVCGCH